MSWSPIYTKYNIKSMKHNINLPNFYMQVTFKSKQRCLSFKLNIYRLYILSNANSLLPTVIRSIVQSTVIYLQYWTDIQALNLNLLSVNILFPCPSLSWSIYSVMSALTSLLKGKVDFKPEVTYGIKPLMLVVTRSQSWHIRSLRKD